MNPDIKQIQTMLRDAGFDPGRIDGLWGRNSHTALAKALQPTTVTTPVTNPQTVLAIIRKGMTLLPANMDSLQVRLLLLTISGQEADFHHRWQVIDRGRPHIMGPARGLWQFERAGGTAGVLNHARSKEHAQSVCRVFNVAPVPQLVWERLHSHDVMAAAFARLLCWTSMYPIPEINDVEGAWQFYLREWRPGAYWNKKVTAQAKEGLRKKFIEYHSVARQVMDL